MELDFRYQFLLREKEPLVKRCPELFEPEEGFTGEHVETVSQLYRRLLAGQYVEQLADGESIDEQYFNSEMVDRFDVMDEADRLRYEQSRVGLQDNASGAQPGVIPGAGLASPGDPSVKPGDDKAGEPGDNRSE